MIYFKAFNNFFLSFFRLLGFIVTIVYPQIMKIILTNKNNKPQLAFALPEQTLFSHKEPHMNLSERVQIKPKICSPNPDTTFKKLILTIKEYVRGIFKTFYRGKS